MPGERCATLPSRAGAGPWKGLDPAAKPVFLGYDRTERMIAALLDRAVSWKPELVVGIMRGGLVPATMAATILAKPLAAIVHERATGTISWRGAAPEGERVLLVDDGCSTGGTMMAVRDALVREGRHCLTLAVVHDPERTALVPDLSHPMRALWRFPWERGEATPAGRAHRATGAGPDCRTEAPFTGLDLDVVLPPDTKTAARCADRPLPPFVPERAILVTGRPEAERWRIYRHLRQRGLSIPLQCRPDGTACDPRAIADYKTDIALRQGCTHFVESDAAQAILIAALAPHLIVTWWPRDTGRACVIGASQVPGT
jgi:adenine/guanine phosphoribosyltransferase-like PRPP-binding protein